METLLIARCWLVAESHVSGKELGGVAHCSSKRCFYSLAAKQTQKAGFDFHKSRNSLQISWLAKTGLI